MIMDRLGSSPSWAISMADVYRSAHDARDAKDAPTVTKRDALYTINLTPAQIAQLDLSNKASLVTLVTVVSAFAMALITSIVVLRLTVRRYSVGRFFLDDYLVILASIFTLVVCSVVIAGACSYLARSSSCVLTSYVYSHKQRQNLASASMSGISISRTFWIT